MASIYVESYGCSLNHADTQAMLTLLRNAQFEIVDKPEMAELIIVNTCTVKSPTEKKILKRIHELNKFKKPIIIAGCLPQADPTNPALAGFSLLGVFQINRVVEIVEETLNGNTVVLLAYGEYNRLDIPHYNPNKVIDIVPICQGCLGDCSYCIVKKARGNLVSYKPEAIIRRVKQAVNFGYREIWLTAQDTGAYGKDIGTSLPRLLKKLTELQGDFLMRVGMANPNFIHDFLDELIEVLNSPKLFKFLHLPLQSGNNEILRRMKRSYKAEQFIEIVEKLRRNIPKITIATDVICGFPGETTKQFQETIDVIKRTKPDVLNISRFWPRPGTRAAKLTGYSGNLTKARSRKLTKIFNDLAFKNNLNWIGWQGKVLIDTKGKFGSWQGRNFAYKPVVVLSDEELLGKEVAVKIVDVTAHDLRAKIV